MFAQEADRAAPGIFRRGPVVNLRPFVIEECVVYPRVNVEVVGFSQLLQARVEFADRLDPSVGAEYRRLWEIAQTVPPEE